MGELHWLRPLAPFGITPLISLFRRSTSFSTSNREGDPAGPPGSGHLAGAGGPEAAKGVTCDSSSHQFRSLTASAGRRDPLTKSPQEFVPARRAILVVLTLLLAGLAAWSADLHHQILRVVKLSEPVIASHPWGGALLFVGLSAISATVVFFSTVLLVPFGVQAWGEAGCFFLLWIGWFLGGVLTYTVGRQFGRPMVRWVLTPERAAVYEARIPSSHGFVPILLAQLALPSEAVGYLCGLLKVPPLIYLGALAIAELPVALGTVLLGTAFFHGQYVVLLSLALGGLLLLGWLHWRRGRPASEPRSPTKR